MTSIRLVAIAAAVSLTMGASGSAVADPTPGPSSGITAIDLKGTQAVGVFDGIAYDRAWGVVHGVVVPNEQVVGLDAQPKSGDRTYAYTAEFEVIAPVAASNDDVVFVEAENRGSPLLIDLLDRMIVSGKPSTAVYPQGLGDGFLFDHHIAYARVQWQTGIAAGVPDQAQGVGEVITRDFGRFLTGERGGLSDPASTQAIGAFRTRILAGVSQSAWFVNAFIAEGFNTDPTTGHAVFGGALAIDGAGNWMTINQLASQHKLAQYPYLNEQARPLTPDQLLTRPGSDPFYIDAANYNDFYRVRASLSRNRGFPANMRRYDWPSPHAPGSKALFSRGCNGGKVVPLDTISYAPYARALVVELAARIDGSSRFSSPPLPPNTLFALGPPPADTTHFNPLPGEDVKVPAVGPKGQPIGGVRFPEVDVPIGDPLLPLPHVGLESIRDTCGNALEWAPYSAEKLNQLYGSEAVYAEKYSAAVDRLVAAGYILAADKPEMAATAKRLYHSAP
jgi:hypothetical protein